MSYVSRALAGGRPGPYEAVRRAWKINVKEARACNLVLACDKGRIVDAYRPTKWYVYPDGRGRWAFDGEPADTAVSDLYVSNQIPPQYRTGRSPFRYCEPEDRS